MCSREDAEFIVMNGGLVSLRANPYHDKAGKFASKNSKGFVHSDKVPAENVGGPVLHRGIVAEAQDVDYESTKRIAEGKATEEDLLKHVSKENVGGFWYSESEGFSAADAKDFAYGEESAQQALQYAKDSSELYNEPLSQQKSNFELPVVLTGIGPKGFSSENNIAPAGMGNSFLPEGSTVHITKISYSPDGETWIDVDTAINAKVVTTGYSRSISESRTSTLSTVERRIIKKQTICERCRLNDDPNKVPVHPNCDCDVVTDSIETGIADPQSRFMKALHRSDVLMEMFGDGSIPETVQLDPVTTAIMDGESVRFSDLARWLEAVEPYLQTAQYMSIVVDDDTPEAVQQVSETLQSIADNIENLPEAIRNKKLWFSLVKAVIL